MKALIKKSLLLAAVILFTTTITIGQRVIKGIVYREGKPAAGITVEAHKGGTMMTSFDGKYEVAADPKSKWIKFTFIDEIKRLDLVEGQGDEINFPFDGIEPGGAQEVNDTEVVLKSQEELLQDQDYTSELSLYTEFYNQGDYKSALPHWRNIYNKYPKSHLNVYIQGSKIFQDFIDKAQTPEEKEKNLQEMMKIYDKRAKYFGQEGYTAGRKGYIWLKYKMGPDSNLEGDALKEAVKTGYEWVNKSVDEMGKETELPVLVLLMQTSNSLFKMGEITKETMVKNYDKCTGIINTIIKENSDAERVAEAQKIQPHIEDIFGKSGAADCEALSAIFKPQFEENGSDVEFIKSMLQRLRRAKCDQSDLFYDASEKLYQLEPSAEAAFNMARRYLKLNDDAKAKEYYKQAMDQETDKELLANYYYEYAYFVYAKEHAYSEARSFARKALEIKPDYCDALMLIGDIYVAASSSFQGSAIEKSAVFWLAVDYYTKARQSEDCAMEASQKIADYRRHFPNKEDAFMEGLQAGQSYTVQGWINERTTVRF